jgi:hypothetical protein
MIVARGNEIDRKVTGKRNFGVWVNFIFEMEKKKP